MDKMISITVAEYDRLVHDSRMFRALKHAGVDNWIEYDYALGIFKEGDK